MIEIGAFEAKTHFSKLLDRARHGEEFVITHRGEAVARLCPLDDGRSETAARAAFERLRRRAGEHDGPAISTADILDWKAAGRR